MYAVGRFAFPASDATVDTRLAPGIKVLAVKLGGTTRAYPLITEETTVIHDVLDGESIVVFTGPTGSAVYHTDIDGQAVDFETRDSRSVDPSSGSQWNLAGAAIGGPLADTQLSPVPSKTTFWFALITAEPDVSLWDGRMATVFAQLFVDDEGRGVHAFLVPIRDMRGRSMPGVRIEDVGEKMGLSEQHTHGHELQSWVGSMCWANSGGHSLCGQRLGHRGNRCGLVALLQPWTRHPLPAHRRGLWEGNQAFAQPQPSRRGRQHHQWHVRALCCLAALV